MLSDPVAVLLGILTILIFMAIFTLLRTMHSAFIKRFEPLLKAKHRPLLQLKQSYYIPFHYKGKNFTLYEINYPTELKGKTVYNNYLFLQTETKSDLFLGITSKETRQKVKNILAETLQSAIDPVNEQREEVIIPGFLTGLTIQTNHPQKARRFLQVKEVQNILNNLKVPYSHADYIIPVFIDPGSITLDYRLTAPCLNELINNPRTIKKHVKTLYYLAEELEKVS